MFINLLNDMLRTEQSKRRIVRTVYENRGALLPTGSRDVILEYVGIWHDWRDSIWPQKDIVRPQIAISFGELNGFSRVLAVQYS